MTLRLGQIGRSSIQTAGEAGAGMSTRRAGKGTIPKCAAGFAAVALAAVLARPLGAQALLDDTAVTRAASLITAASLAQQAAALAADSLWGRTTPSGALDRAAQYVQSVLRQDSAATADVYTYPVPGRRVRLDLARSSVNFGRLLRAAGRPVTTEQGQAAVRTILTPFAMSAFYAVPRVPELDLPKPWADAPAVVVLTGRPTEADLRHADIAGKSVIYVPPADLDSAARRAVFDRLYDFALGAVVLERDSVRFAAVQDARRAQPLELADAFLHQEWRPDTPRPWVVGARSRAVEDLLTGSGFDLAQADTARAPVVRSLPDVRIWHTNVFDTIGAAVVTAPVVAKFLIGSDPALRRRCLVIAAPLDQRELHARGADSAVRRGDPSTLSLAGFLELIRAFQALPTQPKRSVIFLATSGGEPGQWFWGTHYFFYHQDPCNVLSLTVDFGVGLGAGRESVIQGTDNDAGRESKSPAVVAGLDEVEFTPPLTSMIAAHPELGLTVADGGTVTEPRSDAYALLRRGAPSLLLQGGVVADSIRGPGPIDVDRAAQLLRLAFYVSVAAADGPVAPRMSAVGRQRVAEMRMPGR